MLLITGSIATVNSATSPRAVKSEAPDVVIKSFYNWYVHALNGNGDPLAHQRARLRQFASARLLREIEKMVKGPDGLDGDYFLDAQDWDKQWEKNIAVSQLQITGNRANATVSLSGPDMSRKLKVQLVREGGKWKIDKVKALD
jgi:uncharacterized protein DUF3828